MAAGDGLVSMTPTSIAHSGTSATINSDGGVDFSAVTSLSLNGVFTSDYDNYLVVVECVASNSDERLRYRLRAAGTDASGSNYTIQVLVAATVNVNGSRSTETSGAVNSISSSNRSGDMIHVYGPAIAQPTAIRNTGADGLSGATIVDRASTHSLSTSYDGITFFPSAGSFTGLVHVFGYEE